MDGHHQPLITPSLLPNLPLFLSQSSSISLLFEFHSHMSHLSYLLQPKSSHLSSLSPSTSRSGFQRTSCRGAVRELPQSLDTGPHSPPTIYTLSDSFDCCSYRGNGLVASLHWCCWVGIRGGRKDLAFWGDWSFDLKVWSWGWVVFLFLCCLFCGVHFEAKAGCFFLFCFVFICGVEQRLRICLKNPIFFALENLLMFFLCCVSLLFGVWGEMLVLSLEWETKF